MRTHAVLHQHRRNNDGEGRIVATLEDYEAVRSLMSDLLAEGVGKSVNPSVRRAVEAVRRLVEDEGLNHVPRYRVAEEMNIDKGSASRHVSKAVSEGYLVDEKEEGKRDSKLVVGRDMPNDVALLPALPDLMRQMVTEVCCFVAVKSGGRVDPTSFVAASLLPGYVARAPGGVSCDVAKTLRSLSNAGDKGHETPIGKAHSRLSHSKGHEEVDVAEPADPAPTYPPENGGNKATNLVGAPLRESEAHDLGPAQQSTGNKTPNSAAVEAIRNEIAAEQEYDEAASTFDLHVTAPDYITCDICSHKDHDVRVFPNGIARETCLNCGDSCSTVYEEATIRMLRKLYGEGT